MKAKPFIYHEKQSKQLCALHTLNNLFQNANTFTKAQLDELCLQLTPNSWINPHRSMFGLGNYDINVVMAALQLKQCDLVWWDKRRKISARDINGSFGLILNLPSPSKVGNLIFPFSTKHWLAIRQFNSVFYNLDSKLPCPEPIGDVNQLIEHLTKHLNEDDCELFLVNSTKPCTLAVAEQM
uniref:ubiquitinyl hydrolase 1 n=1 Tax=Scapholeberis mucronata TaxID=202097 RepID=A0A4Y7NN06_9CRUS|nr:EOG090X0HOM [Scapholeberis mucronata]SVE93977.1 EOG090X0HOM [Scapholeberis mucronata]